jgi:hypothetical protein
MSRILGLQLMQAVGLPLTGMDDLMADSTYSSAAAFDSTQSCCCCTCEQTCNTA